MVKKFNERTMSFKDNNGEEHLVYLFTTKTSMYHTEHAVCEGYEGKYKWCNRPWQSFDYESALQSMIGKLPKEWRENATRRLINDEDERITKECDAFLSAFQANYAKLSDEAKEALAENAPTIETHEQAEAAGKMVAVMAALGL